jgi:hypothetical protein
MSANTSLAGHAGRSEHRPVAADSVRVCPGEPQVDRPTDPRGAAGHDDCLVPVEVTSRRVYDAERFQRL